MNARRRLPDTPRPMLRLPGADGVEIAADRWGDSGCPVVLLQHGGGQPRHAWKGTGQALAQAGYQAYALDARGHGDSDWASDGDYSQDAMVADLVNVAAAVDAAAPVLVGASMGGGISLCAVGENALTASALILVDTAPQIEPAGAQRIMDFMAQKPDGFDSLEEVADAIATYQPHRPRRQSLEGLKKNVRLDESGRLRWHWDPAFIGRKRPQIEERSHRMQAAAEKLAVMDMPVQLVRGGLSDVLSEAGAQSFLQVCPRCEYVNVTDAAHMVAGDRNDIFSAAVINFLLGVTNGGGAQGGGNE